jgi:hypothetical protein
MRASSVVGRVGTYLWIVGRKRVRWRRREAGGKPRRMYKEDRYESSSPVVQCVLSRRSLRLLTVEPKAIHSFLQAAR